MLGTYDSIEKAEKAVFDYRVDRLNKTLGKYGLHIDDGVIYQDNYIVFKNGTIFNLHGRLISGGVDKSGYRHGLFNGRNRDFHKIIADCFIENPDNLRDVNHKNGNKLDLDVDNLERTTHSDNIIHAYKMGLIQVQRGEEHHRSKLTESDVRSIRSSNKSSRQLAREFGVDSSTINDVRNNKTWRHVK